MKKLTKFSLLAISAATLVACGGGGGESTPSNPTTPPTNPSFNLVEVPLVTSVPAVYAANSVERGAFEEANRARSECGLGMATPDARLDMAAEMHARYLTVQKGNFQDGHSETNLTNPWYRGNTPITRAQVAGYPHSGNVSEGIASPGAILIRGPWTEYVFGEMSTRGLLNAPYHALALLAPRMHLSVGASWSTRIGLANDRHDADVGVEWGSVVHNYGTPNNALGVQTVQKLPENDVLTWPCDRTTTPLATRFGGEIPNPLPGRMQPAGSPFYFIARQGSNLTIKSARLFNVATGVEIPLMPVRHMRNEIYPGTTSLFSVTKLMDSAFVFPDVELPSSSTLRMDFVASVSGKDVTKSVTYRTAQ